MTKLSIYCSFLLLTVFIIACGGDDSVTAEKTVGMSCAADIDCYTLSGGYCPQAGVCTTSCTSHSQCGCPNGTTNSDIAAGKCKATCIMFSSSESSGVCLRTCKTNADCSPGTTCDSDNVCF